MNKPSFINKLYLHAALQGTKHENLIDVFIPEEQEGPGDRAKELFRKLLITINEGVYGLSEGMDGYYVGALFNEDRREDVDEIIDNIIEAAVEEVIARLTPGEPEEPQDD